LTDLSPQSCADSNCRGQLDPDDRLALALSICETRGVRLTTVRREILELLWESGGPTGAYKLVDALQRGGTDTVGPPTVYRALEFLMQQGLVSKIESQNAYIPCAHPERSHICLFFLCGGCGDSVELEDRRLERLITENATQLGFRAARHVVEVEGTCQRCLATSDV
jgi:Fur family zinc uptake transcriptional regulator